MKIARYIDRAGRARLGVVVDGEVADIFHDLPDLPQDLSAWLPGGRRSWAFFNELADGAPRRALADVELTAPVPKPGKYLALGANYRRHLDEVAHLGFKASPHQVWFNKQTSCITGPHGAVVMPAMSEQLDYEGELAVVIGARCRDATVSEALGFVGGYLVANDVSVRDVQLRTSTMTLGKSFDTHGPLGPWMVTPDEAGDPQSMMIHTWVNAELRQEANTSEMLFKVADQIAELSRIMTLEPGDVLATGTPAGAAIGMQPPRWLKVGDVVRVEIDRLGAIENRIAAGAP